MANRYPFLAVMVALAGCLFSPSPSFSATAAPPFTSLAIDQSGLKSFLTTLPPDEADEQLRDWAAYGLQKGLGLTDKEELPLRDPNNGAHPGQVARGRVFPISAQEWGVLVSRDLFHDKPLLGGLIDSRYGKTDVLPEKITFFTFTANPADSITRITREGTVPTAEVFTPAYGYHEATILNLSDFTAFVGGIDDICSVRWQKDALVLGGRKYRKGAGRSLTVENIAALYRAYALRGGQDDYEAFVGREYDARVRLSPKLQQELASGAIDKEQVYEDIRRKTPFTSWKNRNKYVGFSLEPETDYAGLADDLDQLAIKIFGPQPAGRPAANDMKEVMRAEFAAAADRLRTHWDMGPFLGLRWRFKNLRNAAGMQMNYYLENMAALRSFQTAQYYGKVQGTSVGMIMFYTDLLAKLWALDYNGAAPKGAIKGFRTPLEIDVPQRYWSDFQRLSYTRLWFGLQTEGFDIYGDRLLFQPIATRIYAASSDAFKPGQESPPNYQSKVFLGWLDRHFEAIAEYEPYYYRLNQLQKWSCIFTVLKEKQSHGLDFLKTVPVTQNLDFATWRKTDSRVKGRASIALLDRQKYGASTECLPTLRSRLFRVANDEIVLSGGISLASPEVVLPKLHEHGKAAAPGEQAAPGAPEEETALPGEAAGEGAAPVPEAAPAPAAEPAGREAQTATERQPAGQKPLTIILTLPKSQPAPNP